MPGLDKDKAVLLTGGAGFIGSSVLNRLLEQRKRVICIDNFNGFYDPAIKEDNIYPYEDSEDLVLLRGDIRDPGLISSAFDGNRVDTVIHMAAQPGVRYSLSDPLVYIENNINGTINLLESAKDKDVRSFVFISSSSVYGESQDVPFTEDGELKPISPYGVTKLSAEYFCRTYHSLYGLPVTVLRLFTVYGPRQRPDMGIHKFTRMILEGEELTLFGDGKTSRDYTYVDDITDGILAAVESGFDWETINLGDSRPVELAYLVELIESNTGRKAKINRLPEQAGDPKMTHASIDKASKLLDYSPKVSIEDGIAAFVRWLMETGRYK